MASRAATEVDDPPATPDLPALAALAPDRAEAALGSRPAGLTTDEADARLRSDGPNLLPPPKQPGLMSRLLAQLTHFFALLLWAAAVLAAVGGLPQLAVAIVVVVVVNGVFSFVQEERAEHATRELAQLIRATSMVRRDGVERTLPAEELVAGDIVLLREGDRIAADVRLVRTDDLRVDESTLTGESVPTSRDAQPWTQPVHDPVEARSLAFAGTFVTSGSARAVVIATGPRTRLGAIARLTGEVVRRPTPLRKDMDRAVRVIAAVAVTVGAAFFGIAVALDMPARDGFLFSVGVIVALVPEGLLPTLTLSLAISARRMAKRGALVRHLESVETLGATTVICSDKTGTMTTNQMTVRVLRTDTTDTVTTASGWTPGGTLLREDRPLDKATLDELGPALRAAALCVDARLEQADGRWRCVGDPTEGALVALAHKGDVTREDAERAAPRVRAFPFGSERRRMSTIHRLASGELIVCAKGSPETVLQVCTTIRVGRSTEPLDQPRRDEVTASLETLARRGLRVLALAQRTGLGKVPASSVEAERDLEFLGLVGLEDPVRPEVPEAVDRCEAAGIRVLMITGDHPATALAVAAQVGLPTRRAVLGAELPEDDMELAKLLADPQTGVLARIAPEQKLRIARALQADGHVVAMTGDGVNDAPALRQSDIGVAMGITGTDVAREAADLVLLDDDFTHIVQAVEEGRAAFDNIRRFLTYHLTDNVSELAPFVVWALSAGRIPLMLSVLQVLALDIGTDLLPALALGAEAPEPGTMDRAPRSTTERLLNRHTLMRVFGFLGPVQATLSLTMLPLGAALFFGWRWGSAMPGGQDADVLSAMVFAAIVAMQMANALECRSDPASLFEIGPFGNRLLLGAVGTELVALLAFTYVPFLYRALGGRPLSPVQWLPIVVTPFLFLAAEEARKAWVRRRYASEGRR